MRKISAESIGRFRSPRSENDPPPLTRRIVPTTNVRYCDNSPVVHVSYTVYMHYTTEKNTHLILAYKFGKC